MLHRQSISCGGMCARLATGCCECLALNGTGKETQGGLPKGGELLLAETRH
jgi:hypothetical protein